MNRFRSDDELDCEVGIKPYNVDDKDDDGKAKRTGNNLLFMPFFNSPLNNNSLFYLGWKGRPPSIMNRPDPYTSLSPSIDMHPICCSI